MKWRYRLMIGMGALGGAAGQAWGGEPPRLVLQITVDQLRADLPLSVMDRLPEGGLRRLYGQGTVFLDARHQHASTETVVGHSTLATGAHPRDHGMIGNVWYDRALGRTVYNVEDADHPLTGEGGGVDASTEIDPTQKAARSDGRSPRAIQGSTFSDSLGLATNGRGKVFAVSVKDRGAITMAGHGGTAFWFSKSAQRFVSSTYYMDAYPAWVEVWNGSGRVQAHAGKPWMLAEPAERYRFGAQDDQADEVDVGGFGTTFPHVFAGADDPLYGTQLTVSPVGDELTVDFAVELMREEGLGTDGIPDYLSVSLSSTDYVGHIFGPGSLEAEDNLLRLDRTIARLLAAVDAQVGPGHALVVLSADHGTPETVDRARRFGLDAGHVSGDPTGTDALDEALRSAFGVGREAVLGFVPPYVNLDRALLADEGIDALAVARFVADRLGGVEGIHQAIVMEDLRHGRTSGSHVEQAVALNDHPGRSGDIYVVTSPHWFLAGDALDVAATHGSPWRYDQWVPVVFAGPGIRAQQVARPVATVDVAVTLAAILGITPPSMASGEVLQEALPVHTTTPPPTRGRGRRK